MDVGADVRGLVGLGVRTERFHDMVWLWRDLLGLDVLNLESGMATFRMGDGNEIHVFAADEAEHDYLGPGPVVTLLVDDVDEVRQQLERAGIEFVGDGHPDHFRAPDGHVYELSSRTVTGTPSRP